MVVPGYDYETGLMDFADLGLSGDGDESDGGGGLDYTPSAMRAAAMEAPETLEVQDASEIEKLALTWPECGLRQGDMVPLEEGQDHDSAQTFVPWRLVEHYPALYVGKVNGPRCKPYFEPNGVHENRIWDFYYLWLPPEYNTPPILFVPTYQFQHLLDVINKKLTIKLTIPRSEEWRFRMTFGLHNTPRPHFLGRTTSLESFKALRKKRVPPRQPIDLLKQTTPEGLEHYVEALQAIHRIDGNWSRKKDKADKNRRRRRETRRIWCNETKRVQRYLGLRKRQLIDWEAADDSAAPRPLVLTAPSAHALERSVVFVAIDIEAYEMNHNIITEVGLAILDTNDIQTVAPADPVASGWFRHIRARHIRIQENVWAKNHRHVRGCSDKFEFGVSEFVPKMDVAAVVRSEIDDRHDRAVVLVFHDPKGDVIFLDMLSYQAAAAANVVEVVDTQTMHQFAVRSPSQLRLEALLDYLGLEYRYLHNAGNDAVYTLRAMLGLAMTRRLSSLRRAANKEKKKVSRNVGELQEDEGWSSTGENSDGGEPTKLVMESHHGKKRGPAGKGGR